MITLKTLPDATEQEVFDQVVTHLLNQQERSEENSLCSYLNPEGLKCAAGCLIDTETEYSKSMEGRGWCTLIIKSVVPSTHGEMILKLQSVHDNHQVSDWERELKQLADKLNLTFNPPKQE